jgi:hypothetical protein
MQVRRMAEQALCAAAALVLAPAAFADDDAVAYDTISGSAFTLSGNGFGYDPAVDATAVIADRFVSGASGVVSRLTANMYSSHNDGSTIVLGLYADAAGAPGAFIEDLAVTTSRIAGNETFATGAYTGGAAITAGSAYWIVTPFTSPLYTWGDMRTPQPVQNDYILALTPGTTGGLSGGDEHNGLGNMAPGLMVEVSTVVPEPSALALLLAGLLAGFSRTARRRPG